MVIIGYLSDYRESIPTLARWFRAQWPVYYAGRTLADIAQDFHSEAKRVGLPVRLVAFVDGELAGTISLRERAAASLAQYQPGLGGLFVVERRRSQGIGTDLVRAGMDLARDQGYESVYATTVSARGILESLGWTLVQAVWQDGERLEVYRCDLDGRGPTRHQFTDL